MNHQPSQIITPLSLIDPKQSMTIYSQSSIPQVQQLKTDRYQSQIYYVPVAQKTKSPIKYVSQQSLIDSTHTASKILIKSAEKKKKKRENEGEWEKKYQQLLQNYEHVNFMLKKQKDEEEKLKIKYKKLKDELDLFGPIEQKVIALISENQQLKDDLKTANENWKNFQADKDILQQAYIQLNQQKNQQDDDIVKLNDYIEIKDKELMEYKKRQQEIEFNEIEDITKRATEFELTLTTKQKELNEMKGKLQKLNDQSLQDLKLHAKLEEALLMLGAENERLHSIQKEKFKENDQLKKKILSQEKTIAELKVNIESTQNNDEQLIAMKNELQSSHQTVEALQSEINTYKINYQEMMRISSEKDLWHEEIVALEGELEKKNYDAEQLRLKLVQCENRVEEQKKGLQNLFEFENKLETLVNENQRLQLLVNNKTDQLNNLNTKYQMQEKKLKDAKQWELNSAKLDQTIYEKDRFISELNDRIIQIEGKVTMLLSSEAQLKEEKAKQEAQQMKAEEENENLQNQHTENQELKQKIKELELKGIEYYNEINSVKYNFQNLEENYGLQQQEIQRLQALVQQRMNEINEYKKKYREADSNYLELLNSSKGSKSEVLELNEKIQIYEHEIERLYSVLKDRDVALNECKTKLSASEFELSELKYNLNEMESMNYYQKQELSKSVVFLNNQTDDLQSFKSQATRFKAENGQLQETMNQFQDKINKLEEKCKQLEFNLEKSSIENKQLKKAADQGQEFSEQINKLKEEKDKLKEKLKKEEQENEEERRNKQEIGIEIEKEKGKTLALEKKFKQAEEKSKQLEEIINELKEKLKQQGYMSQKGGLLEIQVDELNQKINKLEKELKDKEEKIVKYKEKLKELQKDSDDLQHFKERCINFETNQAKLESFIQLNNILSNREETMRLREELKDTSPSHTVDNLHQQIQLLKKENAKLQTQVDVLSQYETQLTELNSQLLLSNQTADDLQLKFNDNMAQFERANWMAAEIQRLTLVLDEKEQELAQFKSKYIENSELMKKLEDQLTMLVIVYAEMESLRARLEEKEKEIKESRRTGITRYRAQKSEKEQQK